ncbi:uncharacterized protein isoform X2 [Leptinotarsa decemlineata]|uniref:uncharacterized protein isoform X2 n=1 Tax=Leptinotarsa decemlineata TaxID=7539 RepID=UPI003D308B4F
MSRSIQIIGKWLPIEIVDNADAFKTCSDLEVTCLNTLYRFEILLTTLKNQSTLKYYSHITTDNEVQITDLENIITSIETISEDFKTTFLLKKGQLNKMWQDLIWKVKLKLSYFIQELINEIAFLFIYYGERLLVLTLRISVCFNGLLDMDKKYNIMNNTSICINTCPYLMLPMRKISVTRLLQIIAYNRAELCCHKLIDCLLETYKLYENTDDDNGSDNSSLEIYLTLTKHMSPPEISDNFVKDKSENISDSHSFSNLRDLISYEEKNVLDLLAVTVREAPAMLGDDGIKKTSSGKPKISSRARSKVTEYYEQVLWGEVGNYLEHVILWWATCPLSARPPQSSQYLREWITQFIPNADVSAVVLSSLANLADALGVHVTSTSWDQNFRLAVVAAKTTCNPDAGKLFANLLQDLVMLCNQCETTIDWIVGAPLDELPLVEQIPVLHRLDHSIHTTRLWAMNRSKKIANTWNVTEFFTLTHGDIVNCLSQMNNLRMSDHNVEIEKGGLGVHVEVCALMRAKLVSEVKVNLQKLKDIPKECVSNLATVCKIICSANLQMIFPCHSYWRKPQSNTKPENPSSFVTTYLDRILVPVLQATDDPSVTNMILTLICESWLDHIYVNKIRFSEDGALQLLHDFGYVVVWLDNSHYVTDPMRKKLLKNEVLKRCEGVGKLLLRRPGERIKMMKKKSRKLPDPELSSESEKDELMPAEMYVPNQEQWLELRAIKKKRLLSLPVCCGEPYE